MTNTALIPVFTGNIADSIVQLCDARALHAFMQVKRDFTTWVKGRIRKFGFVEGTDYLLSKSAEQVFTKSGENLGGRPSSEYHLTLDMAKELSMVENNDKGREARRYFIACEKVAMGSGPQADHRLDAAMQSAHAIAAQVQTAVVRSILGGNIQWTHQRWMLSFRTDSGTLTAPRVMKVEEDMVVASLTELSSMIAEPGGMLPSNAELASLAVACNQRLALRLGGADGRKAIAAK